MFLVIQRRVASPCPSQSKTSKTCPLPAHIIVKDRCILKNYRNSQSLESITTSVSSKPFPYCKEEIMFPYPFSLLIISEKYMEEGERQRETEGERQGARARATGGGTESLAHAPWGGRGGGGGRMLLQRPCLSVLPSRLDLQEVPRAWPAVALGALIRAATLWKGPEAVRR